MLKYGEIFEKKIIYKYTVIGHCFYRYRIDAVPYTGINRKKHFYDISICTQEKKKSLEYPEYIRAKRNFKNFKTSLDTRFSEWKGVKTISSWKQNKKNKQWSK